MLIESEQRAADAGIERWLVGLNPGVLEVVRHAGFDQRLGRERMLFDAHKAIERYQEQKADGAAALPVAG